MARGRPSSPSSTLEEVGQKEEQDSVVPTPEMYEVNAKLSAGALDVGTTWKGLEVRFGVSFRTSTSRPCTNFFSSLQPLSIEVARRGSRRATGMFHNNRFNLKRKDIVSATVLIAMPVAGRQEKPEMDFGTLEVRGKVAI